MRVHLYLHVMLACAHVHMHIYTHAYIHARLTTLNKPLNHVESIYTRIYYCDFAYDYMVTATMLELTIP